MLNGIARRFDRLIGLDPRTERECVLIAERITALMPRMPWLFGMLIVNIGGLLLSIQHVGPLLRGTALTLLILIIVRLIHWIGLRGRRLRDDGAIAELRRTYIVGFLFCASYCLLLFALYGHNPNGDERHSVILFGSLAALGCATALSPFPAAARTPLLVLALPLAIVLTVSNRSPYTGMGLTIIGLIFLGMRLIQANDVALTRLVHSRLDVDVARRRAELAEKKAVDERSIATHLAETDFLTGLANRRALLAAIEDRAAQGAPIAIALIDLDGFKPVNDTFGHATGDTLLVDVSKKLQAIAGREGFVARLGGDEFAMLLDGKRPQWVRRTIAQAIERIREPSRHGGRNLVVSACAGIAFLHPAVGDPTQVIRMADMALFAAKRSGRAAVEVFSTDLEAEVKRRAVIELALRSPGVEDEIELAYQPIVDLGTMKVCAFEALARWRHSELGWIPPSEFIPITEQISLVEQISDALLVRAAREAAAWPDETQLSFNLSGVHLCSTGSGERVIELVRAAGLQPSRLQIEVTETALLADFDAARRNLSYLSSHGVRIVLDDFGAGYASISYLREMRFDAIKLDGSLITAAGHGEDGLALLKGVLDLCRAVGLPCVAEHVEDRAQAMTLRELGCRFGQGFWLGRPMSPERAMRLAQSDRVRLAPGLAGGSWPEAAEALLSAAG